MQSSKDDKINLLTFVEKHHGGVASGGILSHLVVYVIL